PSKRPFVSELTTSAGFNSWKNKEKSERLVTCFGRLPGCSRQPGTPRQAGERDGIRRKSAREGGDPRTARCAAVGSAQHEISDHPLCPLRSNCRDFSECALMDNANRVDFDSAIRRFESSRPSQPGLRQLNM